MRTCPISGPVTAIGNFLVVAGTLYELTPTRPIWVDETYAALLSAVPDLCCAPPVVTATRAYGAGGIWVAGGGPITLGMEDLATLTRAYQHRWGAARSALRRRAEFATIFRRVVTCVLAHELGHQLDAQGYAAPYAHPEAAADYLAGRLEAALGIERAFGMRVFSLLGCEGDLCTHPPSAVRARAYVHGHVEQVVSMIQIQIR